MDEWALEDVRSAPAPYPTSLPEGLKPAACGPHSGPCKLPAELAGGSAAMSWINQATTLYLSFTLHLPFTDQPLSPEALVLCLGPLVRTLTALGRCCPLLGSEGMEASLAASHPVP